MQTANTTVNSIAQLIAAAHKGPHEMALACEALAIQLNDIHMCNEDSTGLLDQIKRTLSPYEPTIHGETRPGVWVGDLRELNTEEDSPEVACGETMIALLKPLVAEWGDEYRCPTKSEAVILGENYRILGSSQFPGSYGNLIVEVEVGTKIKLDHMMKSYLHRL
jgi:hypothetical protein